MHWTWLLRLQIPEGRPTPYQAWLWWHYNVLIPRGDA